jgi:large subunit ribosomal protein L3
MMKLIAGKKIGMTQIFDEEGAQIPITVLDVNSAVVTRTLKNAETVTHVEVGFGRSKKPGKDEVGQYKEIQFVPQTKFMVKATSEVGEITLGTQIPADTFQPKDKVHVTAVNKGKGFQGVVKRWGFAGGKKTHGGESGKLRSPGSISGGQTLGRVYRGTKMGGHMGARKQTIRNMRIAYVDPENGLIGIAGAVPGPKGSVVLIKG